MEYCEQKNVKLKISVKCLEIILVTASSSPGVLLKLNQVRVVIQ